MKQFFALLFLFLLAPTSLAITNEYKVETIGALTETKVSDAVRGALEEKGLRVLDDKGKTVCEIWFRKEIPTIKDEVAGASFGQLGEGNFIGVINFPANVSDFRGQGVKAGYYTLRFGLILQDGNHLGVSPSRDFFLLCTVADDKDPNVQIKFDDLMKLSRAASGTGHPSAWSLVTATSNDGLPRIVRNEHEHVILETKISTKSGALAIGMIVIGKTEG